MKQITGNPYAALDAAYDKKLDDAYQYDAYVDEVTERILEDESEMEAAVCFAFDSKDPEIINALECIARHYAPRYIEVEKDNKGDQES